MKRILRPITLVALSAFAGCTERAGTDRAVVVTEIDSAGVAVVTISGDPADLPEVRLSEVPRTVINGDAAPFLSEVGEVVFRSDGGLLVEDNQSAELRIFDRGGAMVRLVGGAGDGPGEFRNITDLSVGAFDTTYTFDRRLSRISVFDALGDLVNMIGVGREFAGRGTIALGAWAFDSDAYVLHSMGPIDSARVASGPRLEQRPALLHVLGSTGQARYPPFQFEGGLTTIGQRFDGTSPFGNQTLVALGADQIVLGPGVEYELRVMTRAMQTRRVIRWPGWTHPLEESVARAARDSMAARFDRVSAASPERVAALLDAIFAPELVPATLPILGDVLIDPQGRIWVSRYSPMTEPWAQEDSWHVLDASGRPIARLSLPSRVRLGAVGDDRVALIMLDDLDVEHIRVFGVAFEELH